MKSDSTINTIKKLPLSTNSSPSVGGAHAHSATASSYKLFECSAASGDTSNKTLKPVSFRDIFKKIYEDQKFEATEVNEIELTAGDTKIMVLEIWPGKTEGKTYYLAPKGFAFEEVKGTQKYSDLSSNFRLMSRGYTEIVIKGKVCKLEGIYNSQGNQIKFLVLEKMLDMKQIVQTEGGL